MPASDAGRTAAGVIVVVLGLALLLGGLYVMTRIMRRALSGRIEGAIDRAVGKAPILAFIVGAVLTGIVQSSSAVTSILVPLAAAGILSVEQIFPITLGANVGTTITAILAALAVGPVGLTIALAHLLFNVTGILIVYPFRPIRAVPIRLARWFGEVAADRRYYALLYVVGMFFVVPGLLILCARLF
jgi:sodium-dependent phosphate cotransporter